jgi:hypothetical protein
MERLTCLALPRFDGTSEPISIMDYSEMIAFYHRSLTAGWQPTSHNAARNWNRASDSPLPPAQERMSACPLQELDLPISSVRLRGPLTT